MPKLVDGLCELMTFHSESGDLPRYAVTLWVPVDSCFDDVQIAAMLFDCVQSVVVNMIP